MTRPELERASVEAMVAKWGEAERAGAERIARAKSLETLRIEQKVRTMDAAGATEAEIRASILTDTLAEPVIIHPALGCLDEGPS